MKKTRDREKCIIKGDRVYVEASEIHMMHVASRGDVHLANQIHITEVITGTESLLDLEEKIIESLNSRLFLPDSRINNRIRIYRLEQSAHPLYEALDLSLSGKVHPSQVSREESKLRITGILPHKKSIYTITERTHSNKEKEYRIFQTDIDSKRIQSVSPSLMGGPSYRLGTPTISGGDLIMPKMHSSGNTICTYKEGSLLPLAEAEAGTEIAWKHHETLITMTRDTVSFGKERIYRTPDYFTGYTHLSKDILFMSTKEHLVALDLSTGCRSEYQSWFSLNDIVENGGLHMITGDESGIVYSHFATPHHVISRKAETNMLLNTHHFKGLDRAWIQDPNVFLVARNPDTFYAVYQENGRYQAKAIHVSYFNALHGEVQKDVL